MMAAERQVRSLNRRSCTNGSSLPSRVNVIHMSTPCASNGVPDKLQLLPQELHPEGRSSEFHALHPGMNKLIVLPSATSHTIRPIWLVQLYAIRKWERTRTIPSPRN